VQEPIAAWARPRIRAASEALHLNHSHQPGKRSVPLSLCVAWGGGTDVQHLFACCTAGQRSIAELLLESVVEHTQADVLMDEMNAVDEARAAAAAREGAYSISQ
jgi:hypothetical protein